MIDPKIKPLPGEGKGISINQKEDPGATIPDLIKSESSAEDEAIDSKVSVLPTMSCPRLATLLSPMMSPHHLARHPYGWKGRIEYRMGCAMGPFMEEHGFGKDSVGR